MSRAIQSSAWPPTPDGSPAALPGPGLYWVLTAAVAVIVMGAAMVARLVWRVMRPQRRRLGVDAQARFATRRELRPLLVRRAVAGRLMLGSWRRWLVATESQRWDPTPARGWAGLIAWLTGRRRRGRSGDVTSVAIVGPTRSGKTAECAIPAVLEWVGPAILLSVKRDLMDTTIHRRRGLGEVRVFDPGGLAARNVNPAVTIDPVELARWSPLREAHTASGAKKAGEAMAAWTPKAGVEGGMDFWTSQGNVLFAGLLGAAALSKKRSMRERRRVGVQHGDADVAWRLPARRHLGAGPRRRGHARGRRGCDPAPGSDLEQGRPEAAGRGVRHRHDGGDAVAGAERDRRHRLGPRSARRVGRSWTG